MAENTQRSRGRQSNYKFDSGGMPTEFGPYVGEVMDNVDPTRSNRLKVYIKQFGSGDKTNKALWRTVSYVTPFAGATPKSSSSRGPGSFGNTNNQMSYGTAAGVPDVGVNVICFFVGGDPSQGYYTGVIQEQGMNHMTPTVGASSNYVPQNEDQKTYFGNSPQQPVIEINNAPENTEVVENPKFFDQPKPVHSYLAAVMFQQGLSNDTIRGPITSSSQRESPSNVYGTSTPGRPIYQGGIADTQIKQVIESGNANPEDLKVIGRRGGHSMVMDDGDIGGQNNMVRIRSAKGHQILMSDDGNCLYICHANGQVWLEFGQEGTLDVYTTNSINLRSEGVINLHADKDINLNAGGNINMRSNTATTIESLGALTITATEALTMYSGATIGVKSDGTLSLVSDVGQWAAGSSLGLDAGSIDLNGGVAQDDAVEVPEPLLEFTMPDAEFDTSSGWQVKADGITSIVTRAPSHEPYPYHNQGVQVDVDLSNGGASSPPSAPSVPSGVSITKTS